MRDGHRVLRPGGLSRAAPQNIRGLFDVFLKGDAGYLDLVDIREALPYLETETGSMVDYANYGDYRNGEHRCTCDEDKLLRILRHIGFAPVNATACQEDLDPADPLRRCCSFMAAPDDDEIGNGGR